MDITPYDLFWRDLIWQLQIWKQQGDRIILTMDVNEHILRGKIGKLLTCGDYDLDLVEISNAAGEETSRTPTSMARAQ